MAQYADSIWKYGEQGSTPPPETWTQVRLSRGRSNEVIKDRALSISAWLHSDAHNGSYAVNAEIDNDGEVTIILTYAFSEADTAFEFKMRWG